MTQIFKVLISVFFLLLIPIVSAVSFFKDVQVTGYLNMSNDTILFKGLTCGSTSKLFFNSNGSFACAADATGSVTPGSDANFSNLNASKSLTLSFTSTGCLQSTSGVISSTGSACGGSGTDVTNNSDINVFNNTFSHIHIPHLPLHRCSTATKSCLELWAK